MFLSAAIAHLLAVMSPGPDTAIIFQQSFAKGRNSGILTALGIGFGIFLHCLLAISGISILLYSTEEARFVIKILGASYLIYRWISVFVASRCIRTKDSNYHLHSSIFNWIDYKYSKYKSILIHRLFIFIYQSSTRFVNVMDLFILFSCDYSSVV